MMETFIWKDSDCIWKISTNVISNKSFPFQELFLYATMFHSNNYLSLCVKCLIKIFSDSLKAKLWILIRSFAYSTKMIVLREMICFIRINWVRVLQTIKHCFQKLHCEKIISSILAQRRYFNQWPYREVKLLLVENFIPIPRTIDVKYRRSLQFMSALSGAIMH